MMARLLRAGLLALLCIGVGPMVDQAAADSCREGAGAGSAGFEGHAQCEKPGGGGEPGTDGEDSSKQPVADRYEHRYQMVIRHRDTDEELAVDHDIPAPVACGPRSFMWYHFGRPPGGSWIILETLCIQEGEEPQQASLTPGRVLRAFKRIPLPDSTLVVQPPGGATLVNFDTIFSTHAEPFSETVTLLGQRIEFDIEPVEFVFHHGDGTSETTDWPGRSYSEVVTVNDLNYIVHRYQQAPTTVRASVDTTWGARYRVNNGPWRQVPGTVTMKGEPMPIQVKEAVPALVAPDG